MRRRRLGHTDIEVSVLAFGAWGIGGRTDGPTSYGDTDDAVSLRALRHALALGITFFDTSNVYGAGHSESLIGRAFSGERSSVVIATKVGWPSYTGPSDFSPAGLAASLDGSLQRLQTDYLDLLQLHNPPFDWLQTRPDILETLRQMVAKGKVRAIGVSVRSPEEAQALVGHPDLTALQANFNMMDTRVARSGLLAGLASHGQSLLARTPLCFGFLSGLIRRDTVFAAGDHRAAWSPEQRARWIEGSEQLAAMVERHGCGPLYESALRFCISVPGIAAVLSGMLTEAEVSQNAHAIDKGPLPDNLVAEILALHDEMSFFISPSPAASADILVKK